MEKPEKDMDVAAKVTGQQLTSQKIARTQDAAPRPENGKDKHTERTFGLKTFDILLYPIVNNISVFAISVAATYLTSRGGERLPSGALRYGEIGNWFQKRGDWLVGKFKNMGMSHGQADMSKMVAFSFLDGSLMSPVVKIVEDHRETIGKKIDKTFHKHHEYDDSVYDAEPKQSWLSVLGGRFITAGIVVPTAVALDKTGLNNKLFIEPGIKLGNYVAKTPKLAKYFGKLDVREIFKVALFEAFYTSVCTAGLYVSSRFIAKHSDKHEEKVAADKIMISNKDNEIKHDKKWADSIQPQDISYTDRLAATSPALEIRLH